MTSRSVLFLLPLLVLAGCDRSPPEKVDDGPGQVLPGTISDAMLQTDQLQAEAPLAEPVASGAPEGGTVADEGRRRRSPPPPNDAASPEAGASGAPAATPAAQAAATPQAKAAPAPPAKAAPAPPRPSP